MTTSSGMPARCRLLIVEDEPGDAELTTERLSTLPGYDFEVSVATSLEDALGQIPALHPDAVVLDLNLPDSQGVETLRRIRAIQPDIAIVVLSGDVNPDVRQTALEAGAQDFIGKDDPAVQLLARAVLFAVEKMKVQKYQHQIEELVNVDPDAVVVLDGDGMVQFINDAAEEMFGKTRMQIVGRPTEFPINENRNERFEFLRNGEKRHAEMTVATIDWQGKSAFVASIRDVTERLRTEEKLAHSQKMEAIGQLTGGIAHDFNNLIQVIIASIEMLSDHTEGMPEVKKYTQSITLAADRAAELTRYLLAFARRQPLNVVPADINQLVENTLTFVRRLLGEDIELVIALTPELPAAMVDKPQFEAAILNLCVNARDAMPDGGKLIVETSEAVIGEETSPGFEEVGPGRYIQIAVTDTGCGMAPEVVQRAFDPFFTTKEQGKGTGLGLSMVYGLAKQLGGHAKIYSEVGKGTSIRLLLPVSDTTPVSSEEPILRGEYAGRGERILVVEDNELVRHSVEVLLVGHGYRVVTMGDSTAALQWLAGGGQIDLLFTDIVLPGSINGRQLAEIVVQMRPDIAVMFTSGYTERAAAHAATLGEDADILTKPYKRNDLIRRVRDALDRRRHNSP